jgi:hypothetical protein
MRTLFRRATEKIGVEKLGRRCSRRTPSSFWKDCATQLRFNFFFIYLCIMKRRKRRVTEYLPFKPSLVLRSLPRHGLSGQAAPRTAGPTTSYPTLITASNRSTHSHPHIPAPAIKNSRSTRPRQRQHQQTTLALPGNPPDGGSRNWLKYVLILFTNGSLLICLLVCKCIRSARKTSP